jgi:competence ComEA-like helix-hairpin-helix protein
MLWLHQLQQRLTITRREALALLSVLSLFLAGLAIQFVQRQNIPPLDRPDLFADSSAAPDSDTDSAPAQPLRAASLGVARLRSSEDAARSGAADSGAASSDDTSATDRKPSGGSGSIDLNTATSAQLQELRGIGPSLADRIIAYRDATPFRSVDQLTSVRGIGPKTLSNIRPQLTISP